MAMVSPSPSFVGHDLSSREHRSICLPRRQFGLSAAPLRMRCPRRRQYQADFPAAASAALQLRLQVVMHGRMIETESAAERVKVEIDVVLARRAPSVEPAFRIEKRLDVVENDCGHGEYIPAPRCETQVRWDQFRRQGIRNAARVAL
jgi:hypothetical protein